MLTTSGLGVLLVIGMVLSVLIVDFFIGNFLEKKLNWSDGKIILFLLLMAVFSFVLFFVVWPKDPVIAMEYDYSYNIYALEDNMVINGNGGRLHFYIEQDMMYYHMANYKDGKKMYAVPKDKSYIVEDKNSNPKIEIYRGKPAINNWWNSKMYDYSGIVEYKIVVPEKTIINEFNINMK